MSRVSVKRYPLIHSGEKTKSELEAAETLLGNQHNAPESPSHQLGTIPHFRSVDICIRYPARTPALPQARSVPTLYTHRTSHNRSTNRHSDCYADLVPQLPKPNF